MFATYHNHTFFSHNKPEILCCCFLSLLRQIQCIMRSKHLLLLKNNYGKETYVHECIGDQTGRKIQVLSVFIYTYVNSLLEHMFER